MAEEREGALLGRIAIHYQLITMEQLEEAAQVQGRIPEKKFGEILVELGYISEAQLDKLLRIQTEALAKARKKREASRKLMAQRPPSDRVPAMPPPSQRVTAVEAEAAVAGDDDRLDIVPTAHATATAPSPIAEARIEVATARPARVVDPAAREWLHSILRNAAQWFASDIHIHAGATVKLRRFTQLMNLTDTPLPPEHAENVLCSAMTDDQLDTLTEHGEVDFAYPVEGVGRFRVNVYRQHRGLNGVFHFIPVKPPPLAELGLPTNIAKVTNYHQGLVLVTGPAGCGKSTTLATLVDIINEERHEHVLTIEDPIEYVHPSKQCLVNQRQVKRHTESFARALRAALREDPDVICIGELRDLETISLALSAAETGHLVLATLHTNSTIRTINRIVGVYPPSQQGQVRTMLSESLRAVISQRLLPSADGGGVALAAEILYVTKAVGNLIRENRTFQIHSILQTGKGQGMCLLDTALTDLVRAGRITPAVAARQSDNPNLFKAS